MWLQTLPLFWWTEMSRRPGGWPSHSSSVNRWFTAISWKEAATAWSKGVHLHVEEEHPWVWAPPPLAGGGQLHTMSTPVSGKGD